jgi:DNA-binding PadR family transcriptional regulator
LRRGAYRVFVGKPEGKRSLGKHRHRWQDIKMDVQEVEWGDMDWIDLAQNRALLNAVMNLRVP